MLQLLVERITYKIGWVFECYKTGWMFESYKIMFDCVSVTLWVHEFSVCKSEWVFWVTLQVTDDSANHTIRSIIEYYWFDRGWVFNVMPRLDIIDLIVT